MSILDGDVIATKYKFWVKFITWETKGNKAFNIVR